MADLDTEPTVSANELHLMNHATAWCRGRYRNYFWAGSDTDSWPVLMRLVEKGLMIQGETHEDAGGMTTFRVADAGLDFLRKALP